MCNHMCFCIQDGCGGSGEIHLVSSYVWQWCICKCKSANKSRFRFAHFVILSHNVYVKVSFIHIDACTTASTISISISMHVASKYIYATIQTGFSGMDCRRKNELTNMIFPFNEYRVVWYLMAALLDNLHCTSTSMATECTHSYKTEYNV